MVVFRIDPSVHSVEAIKESLESYDIENSNVVLEAFSVGDKISILKEILATLREFFEKILKDHEQDAMMYTCNGFLCF